jgi:guanylate kinase
MAREKMKKAFNTHPWLVVISGPSGVGKDATLTIMKKTSLPYHYILTATTRKKRPAEKNGVDYRFISKERFQKMVEKNQFLEWANVYGNFYGVPKGELDKALKQGLDTVVKVDVQGASTIKRIMPDALLIFLMPPSFEELANRLRQRYGSSSTELEIRLGKAKEEMKSLPIFDYVITNQTDHIDLTVAQINAAVSAAKQNKIIGKEAT